MKKLFCLMLVVLTLCGCGVKDTQATDMGRPEESTPEPVYTVYFPDDDTISYSHPIDTDEVLYLGERIMTNTTEITVKNTGNIPFDCYLYYPDSTGELDSIQTFTLKPGKKKDFGGLTSIYVYGIWFQSGESGVIDAEIRG